MRKPIRGSKLFTIERGENHFSDNLGANDPNQLSYFLEHYTRYHPNALGMPEIVRCQEADTSEAVADLPCPEYPAQIYCPDL